VMKICKLFLEYKLVIKICKLFLDYQLEIVIYELFSLSISDKNLYFL